MSRDRPGRRAPPPLAGRPSAGQAVAQTPLQATMPLCVLVRAVVVRVSRDCWPGRPWPRVRAFRPLGQAGRCGGGGVDLMMFHDPGRHCPCLARVLPRRTCRSEGVDGDRPDAGPGRVVISRAGLSGSPPVPCPGPASGGQAVAQPPVSRPTCRCAACPRCSITGSSRGCCPDHPPGWSQSSGRAVMMRRGKPKLL